MRKEYDLTRLKWKRNPYTKDVKKLITIRLDKDVIKYFKKLGKESGIPYQRLVNLYLRECAHSGRRPKIQWMTA